MSERAEDAFLHAYRQAVHTNYPEHAHRWPYVSQLGFKVFCGRIGDTLAFVFERGTGSARHYEGVGDVARLAGVDEVNRFNIASVRQALFDHFAPGDRGFVVFWGGQVVLDHEVRITLERHAMIVGVFPDRIFLSHKGADKPLVRDYFHTLQMLGFKPWLDEDAMSAGVNLHRGIAEGMEQSCAAVFFLTPNFRDEAFLEGEIDLAMERKTKQGSKFSIITMVLHEQQGQQVIVPQLLQRFLYKKPSSDLEGLREIIRALPLTMGSVSARV